MNIGVLFEAIYQFLIGLIKLIEDKPIEFLTLIAVTIVGIKQNEINKKALKLNQLVDIYVRICDIEIIDKDEKIQDIKHRVEIRNSGNITLSIIEYKRNGNFEDSYLPYRLPSASAFEDAYYYLNIFENDSVVFDMKYQDILGRYWENQIRAKKINNHFWQVSCDKPKRVLENIL